MIIPKGKFFSDTELAEVKNIVAEFGLDIMVIKGTYRHIYAIIGDERNELLINRIEGLTYVARVDTIQSPYKFMAKGNELEKHPIKIGGHEFGHGIFNVIAGHCTIDPDNPNYFIESAFAIKQAGANFLRGGVWKPRTLPSSYQGSVKSLDILMDAKAQTGLPVVTEVMDNEHLNLAVEAGVDILQIGARNALNYSLLKAVGQKLHDHPNTGVLLKRSMHMGKLDEFISAGEYLVSAGNPNILLCPRGTIPAVDGYRNYPDECITPLLKERTWAPVIVDPSHAVGKADYVMYNSLAACAYGADGLVIECNTNPKRGIGDDPKQAITPNVLAKLIVDAKTITKISKSYQT